MARDDDKEYKVATPDLEGMDNQWDEFGDDDFDVDVPAPKQTEPEAESFDVEVKSPDEDDFGEDDFDVDVGGKADEDDIEKPLEPEVYDVPVADFGDAFGDDFDDDFDGKDDFEDEEVEAEQEPEQEVAPQAEEPEQETVVAEQETEASPAAQEGEQEGAEPAEGEQAEDVELPPEEESDLSPEEQAAKAASEEAELENYRSSMGETDAELADVSAYRNFRKTTKTGGPDKSKNKTSDFDIFANRHKAKTLNQAVAMSDPIVYFYNACLTSKGEVLLFNVYQVLQDRFIGKIIPQLFTAVAEASSKIEELNMASVIANVEVCREYPMYEFVLSISCRFFTKPALLDRLLKALPDDLPSNLIFAFDSVSLQNLGVAAKTGLGAIRGKGIKIMLDNTEKVSMTALTELDYDYIRVDSRYYEMGNPKAEAYLGMIINLAHDQGIKVVSCFCDNIDLSEYMLYMGVDAVQGNAVSKPFRTVPNAVKGITLLDTMLDA